MTNGATIQAEATVLQLFRVRGPETQDKRRHFKVGGTKWIRPGVSFTLPLDEPLSGSRYRILQIDVPVSF